ncbi:MAG: chemotaxis protein CheW [Deltaproteobacteria bacterium]|nr:chemotaxis protein CheW [Deltaproteobacteria bacterium]
MASSSRYVCAWAGTLRVAFAIDDVQEVLAPRPVTRLFHAPPALLGVIGLRGEILPVVDLGALLHGGAPRPSEGPDERLLVLRVALDGAAASAQSGGAATKLTSFAVRVARLDPLRDAGDHGLEPLPPGVPELAARVARGMVTSPSPALLVLDPAKMVAIEELAALR